MILNQLINKGFEYANKFTNIYIRHLIKQSLSKYLDDPDDIQIKSKNIDDKLIININKIRFNNSIIEDIITPIKLDSFIAENICIKIKWTDEYKTTIEINNIQIFYNLEKSCEYKLSENILYSLYDTVYNSISINLSNSFSYSYFTNDKCLRPDKDLLDLEEDINYLINCSKFKINNFEIIDQTSKLKFSIERIIHKRVFIKKERICINT